jgi:hypothetical protein
MTPISLSLSLSSDFSAIAQKDVCSDHQQRKKDGQEGESDTSFRNQNGRPLIETDLRIHNQAEKHNSREVLP